VAKERNRKAGGGDGTPLPDGESGNGNSCGHLGDGEEGVEPSEGFSGDGNTQDGKGSECGGHPWKVSCATGSGNEEAEAAFLGRAGVGNKTEGSAVGTDHPDFCADAGFPKESLGGAKGRPVGTTAHDDADKGTGTLQGFEIKCLSVEVKNFGWD